ncbi:hypothetical protein FRC17_004998 [Serendipita sp. 399]|nr:hypothetical protein FRC17_004998 [Serendipita sp. 399]
MARQIEEYTGLQNQFKSIVKVPWYSVYALQKSMNDERHAIDEELELREEKAVDTHRSIIEKQASRNQAVEKPAQERLEELGRGIALTRCLLSPIAKIPVDVLTLVFQEFVSMGHSAWILVQVCEYWRATALSTASLWGQDMYHGLP